MSTSELITAVLQKVPDADPSMILDLIVECDADLNRVFALLGVQSASRKRQMTFDAKTSKLPVKVTKTSSDLVNLYTSEQVEYADICCSLYTDFLDPSLSNQLALILEKDSQKWEYRRFFLFEREVQSGHSSAVYASEKRILQGEDQLWYQGKLIDSQNVLEMSPEMIEARKKVEKKVSSFKPHWFSQICVTNRYAGSSEKLDYHSDQLTNLGPRPIIAALSLGCTREFRLKDRSVPPKRPVYSVLLPHNSLLIMQPGCQENFKHCVPPMPKVDPDPLLGSIRISLTFRQYKGHIKPPKCGCDSPMILRTTIPNAKGRYKYIWQCGKHYENGISCNETKPYNSVTN